MGGGCGATTIEHASRCSICLPRRCAGPSQQARDPGRMGDTGNTLLLPPGRRVREECGRDACLRGSEAQHAICSSCRGINRQKKNRAHGWEDANLLEVQREQSGSVASWAGPQRSSRRSSCHRPICLFRQPFLLISGVARRCFGGKQESKVGSKVLAMPSVDARDATEIVWVGSGGVSG